MVKRRKMLVGMGALAAGTAGALGTGANNNYNVQDRPMSVDVVADGDSGVIGLVDNDVGGGDIVNVNGDGKLEIDFAEYGASDGVPIDSRIELGANRPWKDDGMAFQVANYAAGQSLEFDFTFTAGPGFHQNNLGGGDFPSFLELNMYNKSTGATESNFEIDGSHGVDSEGDSWTKETVTGGPVAPGDALGVQVVVDTTGSTAGTDENLSGTLDISATSVGGGGT